MFKQTKHSSLTAHINQKRRKRRLILFSLCLVSAIILWGIVYFNMNQYVKQFPKDKMAKNIHIGSADVSGMSKKEAAKKVNDNTSGMSEAVVSLLIDDKNIDIRLGDVSVQYSDADKIINEAMTYGKSGGVISRFRKLRGLEKEPKIYDVGISIDEDAMKYLIKVYVEPLNKSAVNASIHKTEEGFAIENEKEGTVTDADKTLKALNKHLNSSWDYKSFSIDVQLKADMPAVKSSDLENITDTLGSFATSAGSGARVQNIQTGVDKINGIVLQPDEELSFLDKVVPFTAENGYVEAGAYEEGRVVDSLGGGICQVSTTLYNAAIYAELDIVERQPHSMTVNYVNHSRDAAIAEDVKDLIIKNPYDTPVYIEGALQSDGQIVFNIYGKETRPEGRTIDFETEILSSEDYKVVYTTDSSETLGSMSYSGNVSNGVNAKLWKIVYQDGAEVSREEFNTSYYMRSDKTVSVGISSTNSTASGLVSSAVATQDINRINAAIGEAQALIAQQNAAASQTYSERESEEASEE